jgi:hypothetical protein
MVQLTKCAGAWHHGPNIIWVRSFAADRGDHRGEAVARPLAARRFSLDHIGNAHDLFGNQRNGALKVAITA